MVEKNTRMKRGESDLMSQERNSLVGNKFNYIKEIIISYVISFGLEKYWEGKRKN